MSGTATQDLVTLRDWLRYAVSRFGERGLSFGHGTTNAYDEAAYLLLHALHLPLDRLDPFLDARLTQAERTELAHLLDRRIEERIPAAYLTHDAWLGDFRFYVDEHVLIPRSFIAELIPDGLEPFVGGADAVTSALDMHRLGLPRDPACACVSAGRRRRGRRFRRRAGRRAAQRRRLRARRPDQPDTLRPLRQSVRQGLRSHHQQSALRDRARHGNIAPRIPAGAEAGTRRRR